MTKRECIALIEFGIRQLISDNRDLGHVRSVQAVNTIHTGQRGRPRKEIDLDLLKEALKSSRKVKVVRLAKALGVSRRHLIHEMNRYGLKKQYSDISDDALDAKIQDYRKVRSDSGYSYVMAFLRTKSIHLKKARII